MGGFRKARDKSALIKAAFANKDPLGFQRPEPVVVEAISAIASGAIMPPITLRTLLIWPGSASSGRPTP